MSQALIVFICRAGIEKLSMNQEPEQKELITVFKTKNYKYVSIARKKYILQYSYKVNLADLENIHPKNCPCLL